MTAGSSTASPPTFSPRKVIRNGHSLMATIRNTKPIKRNAWAKKAQNRSGFGTSRLAGDSGQSSYALSHINLPKEKMKITKLHIEGFRSLHNVSWTPGDLNIIIGPNGTGKSNLLRFLELISVSAQGKLGKYIQSLGGMDPILWDGQS